MDCEQPEFRKRSCIKGYHIYKYLWEPAIREELVCKRERGNESDIYTVAVMKYGSIGHLCNTKICVSFLRYDSLSSVGTQCIMKKYVSRLVL